MEKKRVERLKGKGLKDGNERGRDWKRKRVGGWKGLEDGKGKGWIKERVEIWKGKGLKIERERLREWKVKGLEEESKKSIAKF